MKLAMPAKEFETPTATFLRSPRVTHQTLEKHPDAVVYYEGQRIAFRPLEVEDESLLRKWINDPVNRRFLLFRQPVNAAREREWIESHGKTNTDYVFGVVVKQGGKLIGTVSLNNVNLVSRSAVLGICIGDHAHKARGYGREAIQLLLQFAFTELNLNRVELAVLADNWRAIRTYQKVGFVQEGCARQAHYRNGRYQDEYRFAMLRSEWEASFGADLLE